MMAFKNQFGKMISVLLCHLYMWKLVWMSLRRSEFLRWSPPNHLPFWKSSHYPNFASRLPLVRGGHHIGLVECRLTSYALAAIPLPTQVLKGHLWAINVKYRSKNSFCAATTSWMLLSWTTSFSKVPQITQFALRHLEVA